VAALHVGKDGTSHVTIRLDPAELGQVQIRIARAQDGTATVTVAAERAETLASLQGDLGHLHQALDRAGFSEQRSISMQLGTGADQQGGQGGNPGSSQNGSMGAGNGGMPHGGFQQGGSQQGARQERQQGSGAGGPARQPGHAAEPGLSGRSGVDFTA